jgi:hypothetical protein
VDLFQSAAGGAVLTLAGVAVYGALVAWARRRGHGDRWPALVAATGTGLVAVAATLATAAASSIDFARTRPPSPASHSSCERGSLDSHGPHGDKL